MNKSELLDFLATPDQNKVKSITVQRWSLRIRFKKSATDADKKRIKSVYRSYGYTVIEV